MRPKLQHLPVVFSLVVLASAGCKSNKMPPPPDTSGMSVSELIQLYQSDNEDLAGKEIAKRGEAVKDKLIEALADPKLPKQDGYTIAHMLNFHFPSKQSTDAIAKFATRIQDPVEREAFVRSYLRQSTGQ